MTDNSKTHTDEISKRLSELKRTAQEFMQMTQLIDGNYENRIAEIKALESKRDRLKEEIQGITDKSNSILQEASESASRITKEANSVLEESKISKLQAQHDIDSASQKSSEAKALYDQAIQRQKEADNLYRMLEERKKKIEEAVR